MNPCPPILRPVRLLPVLALMAGTAAAEEIVPGSEPVLRWKPAAVISMPTDPGHVYQMQVSSDLASWLDSGNLIYGTGLPLQQSHAGSGQEFFRLKVISGPQPGSAPWALEGISFQFNEGSRTVSCTFPPQGPGTWTTGAYSQPFSWTWMRSGPNSGEAALSFQDGRSETLLLQFCASQSGRFTRQTFRSGRLEDTDNGSFGPLPGTDDSATRVPSAMTGRPITLSDLPSGSSLVFNSLGTGVRRLEGTATPFSGNWLVTGTSAARLIANFSGTHGEDYRFTFTGPLTGRFTRQTFTEGIFRDEDSGTFCIGNAP